MTVDLFMAAQIELPDHPWHGNSPPQLRYMLPLACCSDKHGEPRAICLASNTGDLYFRCHPDRVFDFPSGTRSKKTSELVMNKTVYINTCSHFLHKQMTSRSTYHHSLHIRLDPCIKRTRSTCVRNGLTRYDEQDYIGLRSRDILYLNLQVQALGNTHTIESVQSLEKLPRVAGQAFMLRVCRSESLDESLRLDLVLTDSPTDDWSSTSFPKDAQSDDFAVVHYSNENNSYTLTACVSPLPTSRAHIPSTHTQRHTRCHSISISLR